MRKQIENRLSELKSEFEAGQKRLQELEGQANELRTVLIRVSGAIQILEEELAKNTQNESQEAEMTEETVIAMRSSD
jgi:hypothetical protein